MFKNLSLRYKFLLLIAALLTAAISVYLLLAVSLFDEDKTAFIYEGQSTLAATLSDQAKTRFDAFDRANRILTNVSANSDLKSKIGVHQLEGIIASDPNIIDFKLFQDRKEMVHVVNPNIKDQLGIDNNLVSDLYKRIPVDTESKKATFSNLSTSANLPIVRFLNVFDSNGIKYLSVMHFSTADLIATFSRSKENESYLITDTGEILLHRDADLVARQTTLIDSSFIKRILASTSRAGAIQDSDEEGQTLIISYARLQNYPMIVVSQIPRWKAFVASTRLKEKSSYFALLILIVSFMVSILFTKTLTSTLRRLHTAANEISRGNFEVGVKVRSKDEVGALANAFNFMAERIVQLMKETADKARMEKELETAQLVQENFFPVDQINDEHIQLSAHFKSASECGGDWWGHIRKPDGRLIVLIGDATGHGVPSALITAAAHACCVTIQHLLVKQESDITPADLMATLNKTVYAAGKGSVKMTFFIAEIDPIVGRLTYANASHELPVISRATSSESEERGRESLDTLDGKPGNILGDRDDSSYYNHAYQLELGDVFVLYTDGLTECRNEDGDEFGENRLIRAVLKNANSDPQAIKDGIVAKASQFSTSEDLADDITLVVLRYSYAATASNPIAV